MRHISLKYAIVAAFLLVMALPLWLAWTWPRDHAYSVEMEAVEERHLVIARSIRVALSRYEADVAKIFSYFAEDLNKASADTDRGAQEMLKAFGFRHICMFEIESGALLGSATLSGLPCPKIVPAEKLEMFKAEARNDRVTFSPVTTAPDGQPVIFAMQRYDTAVTVGAVSTAYFVELGEIVTFGQLGHAAIVDQTGHVLWHPKASWRAPPKDMSGISVVQEMMRGGDGTHEFYSPALERDMIAGYATLESTGWGVMVPQPTEELAAHADSIREKTAWVLLSALGLAALLALLAAHVLVEPLRTIRSRAEQLGTGGGGSLIAPMGLASRLTEFDSLRGAFNAMVLRVRSAQETEVEARREAQEANRTKSRFLANMSHELRTPLNAIIGFAQITRRRLNDNPPDREREDEYLGYIEDSGNHLLSLIDDLLDLSKIEAGARVLEEEIIDVAAVLEEIHGMLANAAGEKNHEFYLVPHEPGGARLTADPRAVRQILINLATNAIRYTDDGGKISMAAHMTPEGSVALSVTDNGPGIPEEERMTVRRPFSRGKAFERSATPGTGLGLNIVDALSEMHDAVFTLTSGDGVGTIAKITFPPHRTVAPPRKQTRRERMKDRDEIA